MQTEGMIMGIDRGPIFDTTLETRTFDLARGDQLVLFTNGLAEARGASREEFGIERMHHLARRYGNHEVEYFTDKFREYFDLFMQDPSSRATDVVVAAIKWGA
jgi:serine phosphatase RsbU (regulator of sigma subunit)